MVWNTTQQRLRQLEDNGVAECYYCERIVAINPELDIDVPQICDPCLADDYSQGRPQEFRPLTKSFINRMFA